MSTRKLLSSISIASLASWCAFQMQPCLSQTQGQVLPLSELIGKIHFLKPTREICQEPYFYKLEQDLQYYVDGQRVSESQQQDLQRLIDKGRKNCEDAHFMRLREQPEPNTPAPASMPVPEDNSDLNKF